MIERDFIVAWRQQAPWPTDAQVEQDLVLSRALIEIFMRGEAWQGKLGTTGPPKTNRR